jgi:hypothetical protein
MNVMIPTTLPLRIRAFVLKLPYIDALLIGGSPPRFLKSQVG